MKHIELLTSFNQVVQSGSLTKAADQLDMPKSSVSRHISQLEKKLGVQLLIRQGRTLKPTSAGNTLFVETRDQLAQIDEAFERLDLFHHQPKGLLRIQAPVEFMTDDMSQLLVEFHLAYPDIRLCFTQFAGVPDFDRGCDITLYNHTGPLPDSGFIARPLMSLPVGLFTSRLAKLPESMTLEQLSDYALITPSNEQQWFFRQGQHRISLDVTSNLMLNSPQMRLIAAERNQGICRVPRYQAEKFLRSGSIQEIRTEQPLWAETLSLLYAHRQPAQRIQLFTDFLQSNIGKLQSRL